MKTKLSALCLLIMSLSGIAQAAPVRRLYQDVKLPTQSVLERQTVVAPLLSTGTRILSANAGPTSAAAATVTSFAAQPDVARNLVITAGTSAGSLNTCAVTVTGTNILGASINEVFNFVASTLSTQTGSKAFKTVTSVAWAAACEVAGAGSYSTTWNVGTGSKLGLRHCMAKAGDFFHAEFNGIKEVTAPTIAASASAVGSNTATLNSALDGSDVILYYVQNFACFP